MIDTSMWQEFPLVELFDVTGSITTPKNDLSLKDSGLYPYVTTAATNNGISGYSDKYTEQGKVITIDSAVLGTAFYQEDNFTASDHVEKLIPKFEINELIGQFLASVLNASARFYQYAYNDKRSQTALKKETIKLPATSDGQPDWEYMESYMKAVMEDSEKSLENLKKADDKKHAIDVCKWGEFRVGDLFDMSLPKGDLQVKKVEDGNIPLITPSNYNNGMLQRISDKSPSTLYGKGSLTVDMFGNAYYQEEDFFVTAHGHVNVLLPKMALNVYTGAFLASTIRTMFFDKYGFNEMCTQKVLKAESIKLPITSTGEPDWQFMEDYMKSVTEESKNIIDCINSVV